MHCAVTLFEIWMGATAKKTHKPADTISPRWTSVWIQQLPFQCNLFLTWTPFPNGGPAVTSVLCHSNVRGNAGPSVPWAGQKPHLPHFSSPPRGQRVRKATPYLIAFLCFLSQSTNPFSSRVVGLADLSSVTDGIISLETRFLPGLPLWQLAPQRPCISSHVSGTESDCIHLVVHCPVGKVLSGKHQNMINCTTPRVCVRASMPGLGLLKQHKQHHCELGIAWWIEWIKARSIRNGTRTHNLPAVPAEMS